MAYLVDRVFGLGTYIMGGGNWSYMWRIGFKARVGFIHLQHIQTLEVLEGTPRIPQKWMLWHSFTQKGQKGHIIIMVPINYG